MKKYITLFLLAALTVSSCYKQDDIYQQWVKVGGYDYPAKPLNLSAQLGYKRIFLTWEKPMDPAVSTARLYWNNYADSVNVDYADYPSGKVTVEIKDLEDHSYTFDVVNFDKKGNRSLATETTAASYNDSWLVSRTYRSIIAARMDGTDAVINLARSTDQMLWTKIRYKDDSGQWAEYPSLIGANESSIRLPKAMQGKRFQYQACFRPSDSADSVWTAWATSVDGISYKVSGKRWAVSATSGQTFAENTPDKIFDGYALSGCRWFSSKSDATRLIFPKIISVDTQAALGDEYAFTGFEFYLNPDSNTMRYIRDFQVYVGAKPFDPDTKKLKAEYGMAFMSGTLTPYSSVQTAFATQGKSGRYLALLFSNCWDEEDGYIDLWELVPYVYIPSEAD